MKCHPLLYAMPLLLSGACATTDAMTKGEPTAKLEYRTGSNIPRKKDEVSQVKVYDAQAFEQTMDAWRSQPVPGR